ncbi:MAG: Energy-coupling factor transporter ATP-binding protein EcfA1 [Candidatus Heimdallarchaeota archaeon LC_3]|nr:MAG: Energy-coupling factor transporter ATP-binding protein EcfA1 [Candidatus Heimdallarchaeota archaeon LC_3]
MENLYHAIEFKNISLTYQKNFTVFKDVSFKIPLPSCCLLLGQTGSGKTTLLSLMKGIIPYINQQIITGSINVLGKQFDETTFFEISKKIGLLTQDPEVLTLESTVEYDIAFTLENIGYDTKHIKKNITFLEHKYPLIKKYLNQSPNKLSAGEITLLQLIISNLTNPTIILYDEPLSVLDQTQRLIFIETVREIIKKRTIIIATHELDLLLPIADYVIVLDKFSKSKIFEGNKNLFLDNMKKFPWLEIPLEFALNI